MIHSQNAVSRWQSSLPRQQPQQQQQQPHNKRAGFSLRLRRGWRSLFSRQQQEQLQNASQKEADDFAVPSNAAADVVVDFSAVKHHNQQHRRTMTYSGALVSSSAFSPSSHSNHQGEEPSRTSSVAPSVESASAHKASEAAAPKETLARPLAPATAIPSYFGVGSHNHHKRSATDTEFLSFNEFLGGGKQQQQQPPKSAAAAPSNASAKECDFDEEADFGDEDGDVVMEISPPMPTSTPPTVASTVSQQEQQKKPQSYANAVRASASAAPAPSHAHAARIARRPMAHANRSAVSVKGNLRPSAVRANCLARSASVRLSHGGPSKAFVPRGHANTQKKHQVLNTSAKPAAAVAGGARGHRRSQTLAAPKPAFTQMFAPPSMGDETARGVFAVPPRPSSTKPPKSILKSKSLYMNMPPARPASTQPVRQQTVAHQPRPQQQQQQRGVPRTPYQQLPPQHQHSHPVYRQPVLPHNKPYAFEKPRHARQKSDSNLLIYGESTSQFYSHHHPHQAAAAAHVPAPRNPYLASQDVRNHHAVPMNVNKPAFHHQPVYQQQQRHQQQQQQQQQPYQSYAAAATYQHFHQAYARAYYQQQQQQRLMMQQQQFAYQQQQQQRQQQPQRPTHVRHASFPYHQPQIHGHRPEVQVQAAAVAPQVPVAQRPQVVVQEAIGGSIERPGSVQPEAQKERVSVPEQGESPLRVEEEPSKVEEALEEQQPAAPVLAAPRPERPNAAALEAAAAEEAEPVPVATPKFELVPCDSPVASSGDADDEEENADMVVEEEKPLAFSPPARPASARATTPSLPEFAGSPAAPVPAPASTHTTKTFAFPVPNSKHARAGPLPTKHVLPKSYVDTQEPSSAKPTMGEITEEEWQAISAADKAGEETIDERMENPDVDLLLRGYARYITVLVAQSQKRHGVDMEPDRPVHFVPILNRHRGAMPTQTEIFDFLERLYNESTPSQECVAVSLMFITRLLHHAPVVHVESSNWVSILFTAMLLAQKVWDDVNWINKNFLDFGPREIDVKHLNRMEANFLEGMNWDVSFKTADYRKHFYLLCRLGEADRRKPVLTRALSG